MVLKPRSTIFQLYGGDQLFWWSKPEYQEKTTDLSQVTQIPQDFVESDRLLNVS
jgi:hypothetical protein